MQIIRCPHCDLPATEAELVCGNCPACGVAVPRPAPVLEIKKTVPPVPIGPIGWLVLALAALLVGGAGGYAIGVIDVDTPTSVDVASESTAERPGDAEQLAALESINAKLKKELDGQKKQTAAALALVEAAPTEERVKELESLTAALGQDVDREKKLAAAAVTRVETAEREAIAAKAQLEASPLQRIKELDLISKKLQKDIDNRVKQIKEANVREEAARKNTEVIRGQLQKTIEQVRQEGQRAIEKLRQEDQRAIEMVRVQLRKQEQLTRSALADAQRQKLAADEAKKKQK